METLDLAERAYGGAEDAPALLLLHGLLGSSRNWQTAGKKLSESFKVFALDLRNHGSSPHDPHMDYPTMAADVLAWMDRKGLKRLHVLGHSMGGKVAMYLTCRYPERIQSLTVVDIAPRAYPPRWEREFATMRRMPVHHFTKRQEAEEWLEKDISDWAFRKFLVSNLERDPSGGFRWIVNLGILESALPNLFRQIPEPGQGYDGPVLFLRGGESKFVADSDLQMIKGFFPRAQLVTVDGAGHNVHFDQTERFIKVVVDNLSDVR
ncbi:alpha/beta fold hydrolase [Puniceicoccales bacterium CK1056]|uniref:Alpha/beta fold hydrolase n=1 Tax=Oceanipulchritudo coccoides TaxID=2706888 RepID=A0A6B2LZ27_9BACT|nr:alpha/beta fold hydrolase [Oceanipulchritudo coccoides]NDV61194.1 alpha/beta fold hydrolase [Oceanipulchritudo coccoides]